MNAPEEQVEALVIGGGSAGLAVSHELERRGVDHVVLERGRIGQSWRDRWDSFCLSVTLSVSAGLALSFTAHRIGVAVTRRAARRTRLDRPT